MKYLKMVIRLGLFIVVSPGWISFLMMFAMGETIEIFLAWLSDDTVTRKYHGTRTVFMDMYKWIKGG